MTRDQAHWTTSADIEAAVRRRWSDGSLLRRYCAGEDFEPISLPIRGPSASQIGDDLERVRVWLAELQESATRRGGRRYAIEYKQVGGRVVGRNQVPDRAVLITWDEAWSLLGAHADVAALDTILAASADEPAVREWVEAKPLRALKVASQWPAIVAAYRWLEQNRDSRRYLREVDAPGVDTKFIETHRGVLAELMGVSSGAHNFITELGLAHKPSMIRLRFGSGVMAMPAGLSEATFRVDELASVSPNIEPSIEPSVDTAVIIENEITYLSVPVPANGVVIFGDGYSAAHAGALPWLRDAAVYYWGDIDTHGFAIVNRVRASLPQTQTFLMDAETLQAHRQRWGSEPKPIVASLDRLNADESQLYHDLVEGAFGENLRLEQERIDWAWAQDRLPWES